MKILIAFEYSGIVREAIQMNGHNAISCDLLPSELPGPHLQQSAYPLIRETTWDALIAFPPCTHLCISGARWFKEKLPQQEEALDNILQILDSPINQICLENPISIISTRIRKPDQIIQPWQYGHPTTKATCLWLKNLPKLKPTNIITPTQHLTWRMPPSPTRAKERSRTFPGIAKAIAEQWFPKTP